MNMRDLCLMNADKTDISNTNRSRNQTPGIILPGEKPTGEPIYGDLYAEKQRSAGTAGGQENPEDICRGSQHQLRNKSSWLNQELLQKQLQTNPGNNPLKENNIIQVESNCISNSTGENCCWRKLSLQQHSACNYAGEQPHHKI